MIYIDTNVIISYIDEADPNHAKAVELVDSISDDRVVSKLTLVELISVFSRAGLEEPISLAFYSIKSIKANMIEVNFNEVLNKAILYAPILGLRTLDLLHMIASVLAKCRKFATFDIGITSKSDLIARTLGLEIVTT